MNHNDTSKTTALELLERFLINIERDSRIRAIHIAAYLALYRQWLTKGCPPSFDISAKQLMELAKISSCATWHSAIRGLDNYGYISYVPSFNKMISSKVSFQVDQGSINNK